MAPFFKDKNKNNNDPKSIFLGDYFNWDPSKSFKIAKQHGFKSYKKISKTGIYNYADIDDDLISIHHYMKIYKFGFSRIQDNLSLEIRNGRMSRSKAVRILKKRGLYLHMVILKNFASLLK